MARSFGEFCVDGRLEQAASQLSVARKKGRAGVQGHAGSRQAHRRMYDRQKGRLAHQPGAAGRVARELEDQRVVHIDGEAVPAPRLRRENARGEFGEGLDDHRPQGFRVQRPRRDLWRHGAHFDSMLTAPAPRQSRTGSP